VDNFDPSQAAFAEVESLIRSAGRYVQVSEDLRPRVLEAAYLERNERQARRTIARLTLVALLLVGLSISLAPSGRDLDNWSASRWDWLLAAESAARPGDGNWNFVDSFTELRRRQAEALRPASARPPRGV
jgi:hypothetical protein